MPSAVDAINSAIGEVAKARANVAKLRHGQVRGTDDLASLASTAWAWFKTHRPIVEAVFPKSDLSAIDGYYQTILDSSNRHATKRTYLDALKGGKEALLELRAVLVTKTPAPPQSSTEDLPPDFSPLAGNQEMRDVLTRRWHECRKCVSAEAHLAAIVMMGGLLEALFVARANKMPDKGPLTKAVSAPKDKASGKTVNYQDWMLDSYIKVGHELNWITDSAKQIADVLKEYRNYVHPAKELRHQVALAHNDSAIFWQVTKALVRQLLIGVSQP